MIESYGAGVAAAVSSYVDSTPEIDHHLMFAVRTGEFVDNGELSRFASTTPLPSSFLGITWQIAAMSRRLRPSHIHAHSSFGGAFARLSVITRASRKIVYTPHCYAFERRDIPGPTRAGLRLAEMLLALNTSTVAGCSEREVTLAHSLRPRQATSFIPNVVASDITRFRVGGSHSPNAIPRVVTVGRLGQQKDPEFFIRAVRSMRKSLHVRAIWIGDGDPGLRALLLKEGIEVTGWLGRERVWASLARSDLYVHTASWEGFPMAILEAHSLGLPIVARRIAALEPVLPSLAAETPESLGLLGITVLTDKDVAAKNVRDWQLRLSQNSRKHQREALLDLYS